MKYRTFFAFFAIFFLFAFFGFSQNVVNPANGTWSNRQILVLDLPYGAVAYYSVTGNDPESSGFAYDGPVLLDVSGKVVLKIVITLENGKKITKQVSYNIEESAFPEEENGGDFVKECVSQGVVDYTVGETYKIPSELEYCFGQESDCFEKGRDVFISNNNVISRYIPCTLSDGKSMWRYVIHINPIETGVFSRRDVPFSVSNWETITFSNRKYIYKIDDGWWQQPKKPVKIDRKKSHIVYWQEIDYSDENPVSFFVLPPKPEIKTQKDISGAVTVSYSGEPGYAFSVSSSFSDEQAKFSQLYDTFKIDTFQGDIYEGVYKTGVFFDSVYQGDFDVEFRVNKRLPRKPQIISSVDGEFSRDSVTLNVKNFDSNELFVNLEGPIIVDYKEKDGKKSFQNVLLSLEEKEFQKTKKTSFVLSGSSEGAVFYKFSAYCFDKNMNRSNISEYQVIIDTCNFYIDSTKDSESELADGTFEHPYSKFDEILPYIKSNRFVNIVLNGDLVFPAKKIVLDSNLQIVGNVDAKIIFPPESSVFVKNSSLSIINCALTYAIDKKANQTLFEKSDLIQIERGVLGLNNVEFSASFLKNGTAISSNNSVVNIRDSRITLCSENYSCILAAVNSKISVKNSSLSSVSQTCINFSSQGGMFELRSSKCKIIGVMGRIAELFDTQSSITENEFLAELKKLQKSANPIYFDKKNMSIEYSANSVLGF